MDNGYADTQQVIQVLKEEQNILEKLYALVKFQVECFQDDTLDEERYNKLQDKKDEYIIKVNQLNDRFDVIYPKVKSKVEDMKRMKDSIVEEIQIESQKLNQLSLSVEKEEAKLKELFRQYLSLERKKIKDKRLQNKTAAMYYKTMTKQMGMMSYFYDKSK